MVEGRLKMGAFVPALAMVTFVDGLTFHWYDNPFPTLKSTGEKSAGTQRSLGTANEASGRGFTRMEP